MDHRQALDLVIIQHGIVAKKLAQDARIGESQLSKFRKGKVDLIASTFLRLVNALSPVARTHLYALLMVNEDLERLED